MQTLNTLCFHKHFLGRGSATKVQFFEEIHKQNKILWTVSRRVSAQKAKIFSKTSKMNSWASGIDVLKQKVKMFAQAKTL